MKFADDRIEAILGGTANLTPAERVFLLESLPEFEECACTRADLAALPDADLMDVAVSVWREYVRSMY